MNTDNMEVWDDFISFMEDTDFEDCEEVVIDTAPSDKTTFLVSKEEALNFFARAAAIAMEKDYMCDEIDDFAYHHYDDDYDGEGDYDKVWEDITLYFKEIFGKEYHECY